MVEERLFNGIGKRLLPGTRMNDFALSARLFGKLSTAIQQIDYPVSCGKPNPFHGHFFLVGSVPVTLHKQTWPTLPEVEAALVSAGVTRWQRPDCTFKQADK